MKQTFLALLPLLFLTPDVAAAQARPTAAERLRESALKDEIALDIVEGLTTEIGPRLGGTEAEARARAWAVTKLKSLGFRNVHVEPTTMPVWIRGTETAEIVSPFPQKLAVTALGRSGATPPEGITAEVAGWPTPDGW